MRRLLLCAAAGFVAGAFDLFCVALLPLLGADDAGGAEVSSLSAKSTQADAGMKPPTDRSDESAFESSF